MKKKITVLAVSGKGDTGKTTAIMDLYAYARKQYPMAKSFYSKPLKHEIREGLEINQQRILLASAGDAVKYLEVHWRIACQLNVDILVTACKKIGATRIWMEQLKRNASIDVIVNYVESEEKYQYLEKLKEQFNQLL